jgi:hypothetical protein
MTLDSRYKWVFPVKDVHGREGTLGIGIEDGRVIVSAPRWFTFDDPDLAEQCGYSLPRPPPIWRVAGRLPRRTVSLA